MMRGGGGGVLGYLIFLNHIFGQCLSNFDLPSEWKGKNLKPTYDPQWIRQEPYFD